MFGWLKSLFGNEPEGERIVPPPLPSKVNKAEKLVAKKISKKAATKKEAPKKEASKKEETKVTVTRQRASSKKKEAVVKPVADPAPVKKGGRPKKTAVAEPAQTEQSSPNS